MALNLVMLGPPGAGKGTQAERIAAAHGIAKISTGDILRDAVQSGSALGGAAQAVMDAGQLVSDEIMVGIVQERLARSDTAAGFVLDGFPRTVPQAAALDRLMAGRDPLVALEIAVGEDQLFRRLLARRVCDACGATPEGTTEETCRRCGGRLVHRSDDEESVIRERFAVYLRDTSPLVDYYRARPTFRSIDGTRSVEDVAGEIETAIASMVAGTSTADRT